MIFLIVIAAVVEIVGPVDVAQEQRGAQQEQTQQGVAQQEQTQQGVERGPLVRVRPDGVVERFDANEFRFKATGSMFVPAPAGRLPVIRSRQAPQRRPLRAGERYQRQIPQFEPVSPKSGAPGRWDT